MLYRFSALLALVMLLTFSTCKPRRGVRLMKTADLVDPLIGTAIATTPSALRHSHAASELKGQTFPAVGFPRGMTNWTPQTRATETKCLSPYYYEDSLFQGFRASHWKSGSCTQDYGSFTIMPLNEILITHPEKRSKRFSHDHEIAKPYYYKVDLRKDDIIAELSATNRSGLMEFTFKRSESLRIILIEANSDEGLGRMYIDPNTQEVSGSNPVHRIYQGWGEYAGFDGHIAIVFDEEFIEYGTWIEDQVFPHETEVFGNGKRCGVYVAFDPTVRDVMVKAGTSFTDIAGARNNREQEIPHWNLFFTQKDARRAWNDVLNKIEIPRANAHDHTLFYTAMYHANLLPRTFSDYDGRYPGFAEDTAIHVAKDFVYYMDFSLWDTYRALHPLLHITEPEVSRDMVISLITMAEQGGWLPIFPCWNHYTAAMIGDHATAMISDAWAKGIRDYDTEKAWKYMAQNAFRHNEDEESYKSGKGRRAMDTYLKYGFLPMEERVPDAFHKDEQSSRTLEYAYDDFALARFAGALGKEDTFKILMERSKNYRHVIDTAIGYVRGRWADGSWYEPFDLNDTQALYITEGTPFQYTWYVPHDVYGLMAMMGGEKRFDEKLDSLFTYGHYWHGNEPGHQIPYLYPYAGKPWKTQEVLHRIVREEYSISPGGLSGNEDAGQMSAWLVFTMTGFYPVCPSVPEYVLGRPFFNELTIHNANGNPFTILVKNQSDANLYIQEMTLNHEPYPFSRIMHEDIMKGGLLEITMGPEPNRSLAQDKQLRPMSWNDE